MALQLAGGLGIRLEASCLSLFILSWSVPRGYRACEPQGVDGLLARPGLALGGVAMRMTTAPLGHNTSSYQHDVTGPWQQPAHAKQTACVSTRSTWLSMDELNKLQLGQELVRIHTHTHT